MNLMQKLLRFFVIVFLTYGECRFPIRGCTNTATGTYKVGTCHVLKNCVLFSVKWNASMF